MTIGCVHWSPTMPLRHEFDIQRLCDGTVEMNDGTLHISKPKLRTAVPLRNGELKLSRTRMGSMSRVLFGIMMHSTETQYNIKLIVKARPECCRDPLLAANSLLKVDGDPSSQRPGHIGYGCGIDVDME